MSRASTALTGLALPFLGLFYNPRFWPLLRRWEQTQHWERPRLDAYRWRRCRRLISHALETVPYYRDLAAERGFAIGDFRGFDDLRLLPVLGKADYQREGLTRFRSNSVRRAREDSTSGTSGTPFRFYNDGSIEAAKMARLIRENRWAGWHPGEPYVRLWGPHRESRAKSFFYDVLMRRREVNAFHVGRDFESITDLFQRLQPRIVEAYTSAAVQFARLCASRGVELPSVTAVIVSAEGLVAHHRDLIESVFGAKVYNRYGCREVGNIAHECSHGGFHLNAESFHVEEEPHPSIDDSSNLVVTCFDNFAMPFIRYRIGDLGRLVEGSCDCGRTLPLMSAITGRTTDFFDVDGGAQLSFLFFNHFFEQYGGIVDLYQVEQTAPGRLLVRVVPGGAFTSEALGSIRARLKADLEGERLAIEVLAVEEIEREPSGKLKVYRPLRG